MTGADMAYGALAAKTRALYGKRLRQAELQHLASLASPADILEELRRHPGWQRALEHQSPGGWNYVGRIEVEAALREELRLEYLSLAHFVPRPDRPLMAFRIRLAERTAILNALRRLKTGKYAKGMPPAPRIVLKGKVDYEALRRCTSYSALLEACRQTIYYPVLLHLRPAEEGALPDFSVAETLLQSAYFSHMFSLAQRHYGGALRELIQRALGQQADLLNILHILRLKTYFPDLPPEICLTLLFPFRMALKPELLTALCAAQSPQEVFDLLECTPYARRFSGGSAAQAEQDCRSALYAFYKRLLITAPPSVCTAMAYLELKETELAALVNVIESVKYGVPCDAGLIALVGA